MVVLASLLVGAGCDSVLTGGGSEAGGYEAGAGPTGDSGPTTEADGGPVGDGPIGDGPAVPPGADGAPAADAVHGDLDPGSDLTVPAACGNGLVDSGEQCDGLNLNQKQCGDVVPGTAGALTCTAGCTFDTSGCKTLGAAIHVGKGQPFAKIQAAVNSAKSGQVIVVHGNDPFYEVVTVDVPNLTIINNPGDRPYLWGDAKLGNNQNGGLPNNFAGGLDSPATGRKASRWGLLNVEADGLTWDGIDIRDGQGVAIRFSKQASDAVIRNCVLHNHRIQNINFSAQDGPYKNIRIENVESSLCGTWHPSTQRTVNGFFHNWPVNIAGARVEGIVIDNCFIHSNWGGGVIFDGKPRSAQTCKDVVITNNVIGNGFISAAYAHAASDMLVQNNIFFNTLDNKYQADGPPNAMGVNSSESTHFPKVDVRNVKLVGNIASNCTLMMYNRNAGWGETGKRQGCCRLICDHAAAS